VTLRTASFLCFCLLTAAAGLSAPPTRELRDLWVASERLLGPFEAPEATRVLLARVIADIRRLDLASLYAALPDSGRADRARIVIFRAAADSPRRVDHAPFATTANDFFEPSEGAASLAPAGRAVGDGWLIGGAVPLDVERFRVRASTALHTGTTDLARSGAIAADFLRRLENRLRANPGDGISALSAALTEDFPSAGAFLGRYLEITGVLDAQKDRVRLAPVIHMRRDPLVADYPRFATFIARTSDVLRARGRASLEGGTVVATWALRGPEGFAAEVALRDGRLVPIRGAGEAWDLERPTRLGFATDASIDALGLRTSIEGVHGTIELDPARGRSRTSVKGMPDQTSLDGALFGVLTPGALDALVPGSIEGILQDLLRSLLEGREKRGVDVAVRAIGAPESGHTLESDAVLDVSSARLVRVALTIGARWLYPSDEEAVDARRFAHDLASRLVADAR
jgi:hypothetical protein